MPRTGATRCGPLPRSLGQGEARQPQSGRKERRSPPPARARAPRNFSRQVGAQAGGAHAEEITDAYLRGVRSDDERVAYRAAEAWVSRVYGRPKETIETVKPTTSDPLELDQATP